MTWLKLPAWKDEYREVYRKKLISHIERIKQRAVRTDADDRRLAILEKELKELERRERIAAALQAAGYDGEPTYDRLKECFLDYVGAGYFGNLDLDDAEDMIQAGEITENDMIYNLIKKG